MSWLMVDAAAGSKSPKYIDNLHNGDLENARKMIDVAHSAGADAVKFQKRTIDQV